MLAVVLAAGRGTRLGGLTEQRSKGMMPVAGKPMIERVLEMLAAASVDRFAIVVHPEDSELLEFLDGPNWSHRTGVAYQEERLGMAHALAQAAPLVRQAGAGAFVLASCDNLYPAGHVADLILLRESRGLDGALTLKWASRREATTSAVVRLSDDRVTELVEKPRLDDVPSYDDRPGVLTAPSLYVLASDVLPLLSRVSPSPRGEFEFPSALGLWIAEGARLGGRIVERRWTLTRPADLLALNLHFLRTDPACCTVDAPVPDTAAVEPLVRVEPGASIGPGATLGPQVFLEAGSRLGPRAVVRRSVVLRGASVGPGETVENSVVGPQGVYPCPQKRKEAPGKP